MAGVVATGLTLARRVSRTALAVAGVASIASSARAVEALEGRIQLHGFAEMQLRALDEKFAEELDLAQWYNILNLELEFDVAPDGIGPIDLLSAYVRVEGRYDAIYSNGFGMFPSVNTYGDEAENLPERLRDSDDREMGGVIRATDRFGNFKKRRISDRDPALIVPPTMSIPDITPASLQAQKPGGITAAAGGPPTLPPEGRQSAKGERRGYPGFDTFFQQAGPDDDLGTADDPARYVHEHISDFAFTFKEIRGPIGSDTQILGPWLPKNFIRAVALNTDRANPFRGRVAPTRPMVATASPYGVADVEAIRYHSGDTVPTGLQAPNLTAVMALPPPDELTFRVVDTLDPTLARILLAPDDVFLDIFPRNTLRLNQTFPGRYQLPAQVVPSPDLTDDYGGDFMGGVVPCADPTEPTLWVPVRNGLAPSDAVALCIESSSTLADPPGSYTEPSLTKMTGGKGESPFRPAPDVPSLGSRLIARNSAGEFIDFGDVPSPNSDLMLAQGLYIPSKGMTHELDSGRLDSLQFNYDEVDRSWNRGQSQENNKELKEAYADIEVLESRLWIRLGLQNIVWGKTELFRTTDQFNPQDLALSSLPSLEESRIALWSARFVYSLYDIGPLEDVRAEFAFNFDQYQPSDLGACGEPYTPDIVCVLTNGILAHSLLGIGIAGVDRPESPWKDIGDLEFGGRIEWRWDRFSFALMDFYGYSDFPHPDSIYYYERGVDYASGRPLIGRLPNAIPSSCGQFAGELAADSLNAAGLRYNSSFASHPYSITTGAPEVIGNVVTNRRGGVGRDRGCLRPGGAPGGSNSFFNETEDNLEETNALEHHHANQQVFAWVCAGTVGIAATLDAGSCAWTIFATDAVLNRQLLPISFIESLTALFAGEQTGPNGPQRFLGLVSNNTKDAALGSRLTPMPIASLNMLFNNPLSPFDRNGDGDNTDTTDCGDSTDLTNCDLGGYDGFDGRVQVVGRLPAGGTGPSVSNFITLDRSLTNEQRALLGCGPFYASRCDSSLTFRDTTRSTYFANYGGLDFMNMEASALVQSWPGIEGTLEGHTTTSQSIQPGTVGWIPTYNSQNDTFDGGIGGPICTRFMTDGQQALKLPGCRGVRTLNVDQENGTPIVEVEFETGYMPSVDGCVIGTQIRRSNGAIVQVRLAGASIGNSQLASELALCNRATTKKVVPRSAFVDTNNDGVPDTLPNGQPDFGPGAGRINPNCLNPNQAIGAGLGPLRVCSAQTVTLEDLPLLHPVAGCVASVAHFPVDGADDCRYWMYRNLVDEMFQGTAQLFQNELAAFSWNFLMFLTLTSCNIRTLDLDGNDHRFVGGPEGTGPRSLRGDPSCFDPDVQYDPTRCSIAAPQYCSNVKGFFAAAGVTRNTALAGGNEAYGRRTFIWHSGGEAVLRYEQRNVLGLSSDFAEDVTKTNWGVEFTYIENLPFQNNDSFDGISESNAYNLTISVDRPTFINFLNPNRTFFFNSQWFISYLDRWQDGYTTDGPFNVLFTFAMFTGYFQDRVQPQFVTVYDFNSKSGALLPSLQYRFTESFSVTVGLMYFFGHTELRDMPLQSLAPAANRSGANANEDGVDNLLSLVRTRDELFMRLRWTF